jgi:hypothetical protein
VNGEEAQKDGQAGQDVADELAQGHDEDLRARQSASWGPECQLNLRQILS